MGWWSRRPTRRSFRWSWSQSLPSSRTQSLPSRRSTRRWRSITVSAVISGRSMEWPTSAAPTQQPTPHGPTQSGSARIISGINSRHSGQSSTTRSRSIDEHGRPEYRSPSCRFGISGGSIEPGRLGRSFQQSPGSSSSTTSTGWLRRTG